MDWIIAHWAELSLVVTGIITVASVIAKWTPTEVDDNLLGKFIMLMDIIGLNNKPTEIKSDVE